MELWYLSEHGFKLVQRRTVFLADGLHHSDERPLLSILSHVSRGMDCGVCFPAEVMDILEVVSCLDAVLQQEIAAPSARFGQIEQNRVVIAKQPAASPALTRAHTASRSTQRRFLFHDGGHGHRKREILG